MAYIEIKNLEKIYILGETQINALNGISFNIEKGEFIVVLGPSGSGKSTLLNLLGGMDFSSSGDIIVDGKNITKLNRKEITRYRREDIGFIFQFYNLLPSLSARENVEVAANLVANPLAPLDALDKVGLKERSNHFIGQLSGGEQQRTSIARAICKNPKLLLCDEPTGALDSLTGKKVLTTLWDLCKINKQTVVIVTHNSFIAQSGDKVIHLQNGKIKDIEINSNPKNISEVDW